MGGKQMEGDNAERRKLAKDARDAGKKPSEVGATLGASKQRNEAEADMTRTSSGSTWRAKASTT